MIIHLQTSPGKRLLLGPARYPRYLLVALSIFGLNDPSLDLPGVLSFFIAALLFLSVFAPYFALVFYSLLNFRAFKRFRTGRLAQPRWTLKASFLVLGLMLGGNSQIFMI